MKNYAKVGNRQGRPGYRTPAMFRIRQTMKVARAKSREVYRVQDTASNRRAP